jgi:hypothetical protein
MEGRRKEPKNREKGKMGWKKEGYKEERADRNNGRMEGWRKEDDMKQTKTKRYEIPGSHGGACEDCCFLICDDV